MTPLKTHELMDLVVGLSEHVLPTKMTRCPVDGQYNDRQLRLKPFNSDFWWMSSHGVRMQLCDPQDAYMIYKAHFLDHIIGEGYHTIDWNWNSDKEELQFTLYDDIVTGKTDLECLVKAILEIDKLKNAD